MKRTEMVSIWSEIDIILKYQRSIECQNLLKCRRTSCRRICVINIGT